MTSVLVACLFFTSDTFAQQPAQLVVGTQEADSAELWLSKMSNAMRSLNYKISFVLLKPGVDSQPFIWRHAVDENGLQMEQLNQLNGPGREALRLGNKISYFEPNVAPYSLLSSSINGPFPYEFFQYPEKLSAGYDLVLVGKSRISGRAAQQIRVVSKDNSRFGLNLWLDQKTGLLLKLNMFNLKAQLLEQIQVTSLEVTQLPDAFFTKIDAKMLPEVISLGTSKVRDSPWQINYLPVGMQIRKRELRRLSASGKVVEYVMISDGLVDVSMYLNEGTAKPLDTLVAKSQSDTVLSLQHAGLNVVVIGKLPASTANKIVTSIQRVEQGQ
jgi:sigma-E factor negative regulatory protein RseB